MGEIQAGGKKETWRSGNLSKVEQLKINGVGI